MSTSLTAPLKPIQVCEKYFKSGRLLAMEINTPSFNIDEKTFKFFALDAMEEKFRQIEYMAPKAAAAAYQSITDPQNARYSQEAAELSRKTLAGAFTTLVQSTFSGISSEEKYAAFADISEKLENTHKKNKLAATLLIIKEQFNEDFYNQAMNGLENHFDKNLFKEIKTLVAKPDLTIIKHVHDANPQLAQEKFPKATQQLKSLEEPINFGLKP